MAWNEPGGSGKDKDPWGGGNGGDAKGESANLSIVVPVAVPKVVAVVGLVLSALD